MSVCVSVLFCMQRTKAVSLPSPNPGHYSVYWYSIKVHHLRFHLSHFLSSVQWWDNLYVFNKVYATIHRSSTSQSATQKSHKDAVERKEVDQPFCICVAAQRHRFLLCSLWQMNTKKKARRWCGEDTQVSITSPETAGASTNQASNRDLDFTHWCRQPR